MSNSDLILLTDSFYPLKDSTSKINTRIVNYLSKSKKITIVCAKDIFSKEKIFSKSNENIFIRRLPIPFANTRSIYLKLIKFIIFDVMIFIYLTLQKRDKKNLPS